jgi:hypothetical protein
MLQLYFSVAVASIDSFSVFGPPDDQLACLSRFALLFFQLFQLAVIGTHRPCNRVYRVVPRSWAGCILSIAMKQQCAGNVLGQPIKREASIGFGIHGLPFNGIKPLFVQQFNDPIREQVRKTNVFNRDPFVLEPS